MDFLTPDQKNDVFKFIQSFNTDKTLITIGSGISVAFGIPGMAALAEQLNSNVPAYIKEKGLPSKLDNEWNLISESLSKDNNLEAALSNKHASSDLTNIIREITYSFIYNSNYEISKKLFIQKDNQGLSKLINVFMPHGSDYLSIITTNYDLLIEYACLKANLSVDTLFYGFEWRQFKPDDQSKNHLKFSSQGSKRTLTHDNDYVLLLKPHGSINWFSYRNRSYSTDLKTIGVPDIITPGIAKYESERKEPFNKIYDKCNSEIDRSDKYMFLGYGYNDKDLQDHYDHPDNSEKPKLIVTYKATTQINELFQASNNCMIIQAYKNNNYSEIQWKSPDNGVISVIYPKKIWDITELVEDVFK